MSIPPFVRSTVAGIASRGAVPPPTPVDAAPAGRRARLSELDPHFHCSVIGTCLGTGTLRRLVRRLVAGGVSEDGDLAIHHEAVLLANAGGAGAKAIGKALDDQHAATIRRVALAPDEAALGRLWDAALKSGEVPGAYWALMTHPRATPALQGRLFGDVHMLSHLVGAANRADIRRLVALEGDNAALHAQNDALQTRLQELAAERDEQLARLRRELAQARGEADRLAVRDGTPAEAAAALADATAQAGLHAARHDQLERDARTLQLALDDAHGRLAHEAEVGDALRREVASLEAELAGDATAAVEATPLSARLRGRRVLYVGGRLSTLTAIRALAEGAGAQWLHHDGGLEDRKGLLAAMLPRADCVVFPVDCIDHDSMQQLKRLCARHGLPFHPLRTSGVASFVAALAVDASAATQGESTSFSARCCVRHG